MEAQAKAVNVLYYDAVLCRAAPYEAESGGGFVSTAEPMPVGAEVTVELLGGEGPDATPVARLVAKVLSVREEVTGGPAPGMKIRFTGAEAAAAEPARMKQAMAKPAQVAAPTAPMADLTERTETSSVSGESVEASPSAGSADDSAQNDQGVPLAEVDPGVSEAGPAGDENGEAGEGGEGGEGGEAGEGGEGGEAGEGGEGGEGGKKKRKRRRKKK